MMRHKGAARREENGQGERSHNRMSVVWQKSILMQAGMLALTETLT